MVYMFLSPNMILQKPKYKKVKGIGLTPFKKVNMKMEKMKWGLFWIKETRQCLIWIGKKIIKIILGTTGEIGTLYEMIYK